MQPRNHDNRITVFYDGSCPLCRREISFYMRRRGARNVDWCDVSKVSGVEVAPGLSRPAAMARFHVRNPDGDIVSGGDAFRSLWLQFSWFRPLALLLGAPGLRGLVNRSYDFFLKFRPALQSLVKDKSGT